MGIYLNPNNELFQNCLNSEIYVDKTELIHFTNKIMNTRNNLLCVSRPRRFGKSMALEMLSAYYSKGCNSGALFERLKVSMIQKEEEVSLEKHTLYQKNMNHYDVLYVDMQGIIDKVIRNRVVRQQLQEFNQRFPSMLESERDDMEHPKLLAIQREIIRDIKTCGEYEKYVQKEEDFLGNVLYDIYHNTGNKFIVLIDEWDCVFRNNEKDKFLQDKYIDWLRSMFKNTELLSCYAFVYMTGILPVKRYGTQSALNNFREYTFLNPGSLAEFAGFTEDEVKELCERYDVDFEEMSRWYNGYQFNKIGKIYNPRSVVCAIEDEEFHNYWTSTGTYKSVKNQIEMDFEGLKQKVITMLGGGRCKVDTGKFQNDMVTFESADDVLTFLVHLGYLGYDAKNKETYIPNMEIRDEFVNAIEGNKYANTFEAIKRSEELLEATLEGDEEKVAEMIESAHEEHASILKYNDENALSCIVQIAYYQAQDYYKIIREMPAGKGFCDIAFLPRPNVVKPGIIVELKWNKAVKTAIDQIKERNYVGRLKDYIGEVLLVGISYDKDSADKKHTCSVERMTIE